MPVNLYVADSIEEIQRDTHFVAVYEEVLTYLVTLIRTQHEPLLVAGLDRYRDVHVSHDDLEKLKRDLDAARIGLDEHPDLPPPDRVGLDETRDGVEWSRERTRVVLDELSAMVDDARRTRRGLVAVGD